MNARIEQLIQQATITEDHYPAGCNGYPEQRIRFDKVKFAELIVKECADAADMAYNAQCKFPGDYVAEQMGYGEEIGVVEWRSNGEIK